MTRSSSTLAREKRATRENPFSRVESITPEKASSLLKLNTHNRDLNTKRVRGLAGAIKRGEWKLNGDAVVLSGNGTGGVLLNGQHRLYAVIEAGVAITVIVLYNAAPESQETMDSGLPRNMAQKLKLRGEKYYGDLAGALGLAWNYDNLGNPDHSLRSLTVTHQQLFDYLDTNPGIRDWLPLGLRLRHEFLSPGGSWGGWAFLFAREVDEHYTNQFFTRLLSGVELHAGDPILLLRNLLVRQRQLASDRRFGQGVIAGSLVKAFNAFCLGQQPKILKYDTTREDFPQIVSRNDMAI